MTFRELLVKYHDEKEDVINGVVLLYPDQENNAVGYSDLYDHLLTLEPAENTENISIRIDLVVDEFEGEIDEYLGVSGVKPDSDESWGLSLVPWEEWLGMDIYTLNLSDATDIEFLAACLWEMTWYGFTQEKIQEQREEIYSRIQEIEDGTAKTVSWDVLKQSLDSLDIED